LREKAERELGEDAKRLSALSEEISADVSILASFLGTSNFSLLKASAMS